MAKAINESREIKMESRVQQVTLACSRERVFIAESISVSKVPPSFSPTNTWEAATTEHMTGTQRKSIGHSNVVKAAIHCWRGPCPSKPWSMAASRSGIAKDSSVGKKLMATE